MNIDGVHNMVDFEVIEIVDENQSYPSLMGLKWDFDNQSIIKLKRREIISKVGDLKVTAPLDPYEGKRYTDPTIGNDIDNLYNQTALMEDHVKPTTNGALSWRSISSCTSDLEVGLEN